MSQTIRFPLLTSPKGGGVKERELVLTLLSAVSVVPRAGAASYTSLEPWKLDANGNETPFTCVVVEFLGTTEMTIGNGTNAVGLYGEIIDNATSPPTSYKTLLGVLGFNFAGTLVPQIPLDEQAGNDLVGFSQVVSNVAMYDALSVGIIGDTFALAEGESLTVRVRPIFQRSFMG